MATTTKKVSVTGTTTSAAPQDSKGNVSIAWTESKTAGTNVFNVDNGTKTATLALTGTSGDVVKINGYSGDYSAMLSGTKLTLQSNTQTITVTLAKASTVKLTFADGDKIVDTAAAKLGAQVLTKVLAHLDGVTAHEAAALKAALTDAAGHYYATVDAAITSNDAAAISAAVSTATGSKFTTVADLFNAYNAYATPTFSVVSGGDAKEGANASFVVTLSAAQPTATNVTYALNLTDGASAADVGSATVSTGVSILPNNVLSFAPGVTSATITLPVIADSISSEAGEGLSLALTAITGSAAKVSATFGTGALKLIDVPPSTIAISPTNATVTATPAADTFNVAAGNYTASIAGFGTGDTLVFAPTTVTSVTNTSGADGNLTVTGSLNNQVVTVNLTGVSAAQDAQIYDVNSFLTAFAPVGPPTTNSISPTATTATATTGPDTFNIASGNYTASIAGFGAKDKLVFAAGTVEAITNTSGTDGNITVTGSLNNQLVTIQLTGVSATLDSHVFDAASFNTAFGTGSLV